MLALARSKLVCARTRCHFARGSLRRSRGDRTRPRNAHAPAGSAPGPLGSRQTSARLDTISSGARCDGDADGHRAGPAIVAPDGGRDGGRADGCRVDSESDDGCSPCAGVDERQAAPGRPAEPRAPRAAVALAIDARAAGADDAAAAACGRRRRCAAGPGHRRLATTVIVAAERERRARAGADGRHQRYHRAGGRGDIADDGERDGRGERDAARAGRGDGPAGRCGGARRLDGNDVVGGLVAAVLATIRRRVDRAQPIDVLARRTFGAARRPVDLEPSSARRMDDGQDARRRQHGQGQAGGQQQDGREGALRAEERD